MNFLTKNIKTIAFAVFALLIIAAAVWGHGERAYTESFFAFDTAVTMEIYGKNAKTAAAQVKQTVYELDNIISAYKEDSFTSRYNNAPSGTAVEIPQEISELVKKSIELSEKTEGFFDITVFPLVKLWDVKNAKTPPKDEDIKARLEYIGSSQLEIKDGALIKKEGVEIDFGAVAKGYIADIIHKTLENCDAQKAVVNIGGNVCAIGTKSRKTAWNIGIANPFSPNEVYLSVAAENTNVITSGAYQRYFEYSGERYHHILSPFDGYPAKSDVASVTVISESGAEADAFSTAVFAAGAEKGAELLEKQGLCAVIIKEDGKVETVGDVNILKTFY